MSATLEGMKASTAAMVREIYRPILRGYFAVFAAYYAFLLPTNFWYYQGLNLIAVVAVALITSCLGVLGFVYLRRARAAPQVERLLIALNVLVVVNVMIALNIEFMPTKLPYFVIMVILFALASVSLRQSILSIAIAIGGFLTFLPRLNVADTGVYSFLVFGAVMASLSIAFYLRKAIGLIAQSKLDAEDRLKEARSIGENMRQKSLSDSLTGLPNRRAFFEALRKATGNIKQALDDRASSEQMDDSLWLILVDLDGFKAVNDVHGHLVGDLLLKEVADRLKSHCHDEAHVSRMGGDEFNIILVSPCAEEQIKSWCDRLLDSLAKPYVIEGRHVRVSGSMGCRVMDLDEAARPQINEADYALMAAKKQGKNRCVVFNEAHAKQAAERHMVEQALRFADLENEIELLFQPQVDLRQNKVVRAEALARWTSPMVGLVEPSRFIKVAEEGGLITDITLTVVSKAFRTITGLSNRVPLAINLSSHDVITDPIIDQIIQLAKEHEVDPRLIEFEVTETAMMADIEKATANLKRLAELGFSIALDDFGTGYSNFNYLRHLPIEKLKVDRSFLENSGDPMTEKVLFSLAGMARTLGVECLLEGIENEVDLLMAKRVGVDAVQGFLFGKPMSADALAKLLDSAVTAEAIEPSNRGHAAG